MLIPNLAEIRHRALAALIPCEPNPLSQWIEDSIVLPEGLCACPGPMRLYPHQVAIADAIGDPGIERVTLQKAAPIGFSALLAAAIGNFCINDPSPILAVQPTQDDCRDFVVSDLEPMFKATSKKSIVSDHYLNWSITAYSDRQSCFRTNGRDAAGRFYLSGVSGLVEGVVSPSPLPCAGLCPSAPLAWNLVSRLACRCRLLAVEVLR